MNKKIIILLSGIIVSYSVIPAITHLTNQSLTTVEKPCGDGSFSGLYVNIMNNTNDKVQYWYTYWYSNGQGKEYIHNVKKYSMTYDWMWSDYKHSHCMEIYHEIDSIYHTGFYTVFIWNGTNGGYGYVREYQTVQQWPDYANPKFDYKTWTCQNIDWYPGGFNDPQIDFNINK